MTLNSTDFPLGKVVFHIGCTSAVEPYNSSSTAPRFSTTFNPVSGFTPSLLHPFHLPPPLKERKRLWLVEALARQRERSQVLGGRARDARDALATRAERLKKVPTRVRKATGTSRVGPALYIFGTCLDTDSSNILFVWFAPINV